MKTIFFLLGLICLSSAVDIIGTYILDSESNSYSLETVDIGGKEACTLVYNDGEYSVVYTLGAYDCEPANVSINDDDVAYIVFNIESGDDLDLDGFEDSAFNQGIFTQTPDHKLLIVGRLDKDLMIDQAIALYTVNDSGEETVYGEIMTMRFGACDGELAFENIYEYKAPSVGDDGDNTFEGIDPGADDWTIIDISQDEWEIKGYLSPEEAKYYRGGCSSSDDGEDDNSSGLLAIANLALVALGLLAL